MSEIIEKSMKTGLEIAVIGLAAKFPGADNIDEFWENLKNGIETLTFFSEKELIEAGLPEEQINNPNYVKAKSLVKDIEYFDGDFFGYTPLEAEVMDPQIRLFHECVWHALEDAGYDPETYNGLIGLYAGARTSFHWESRVLSAGREKLLGSFVAQITSDKDYLGSRISYKLNLKGPCCTIQSACSTSLVAIHLAGQGLLSADCDMALAGGICLYTHHRYGHRYQEGMILSPDGHCRAFDAEARGTHFGEGMGIAVLKRNDEAVRDGDHIYAVIKGSAYNNDGTAKIGFSAPGVRGQADVIRIALRMAEVDPETISYIEAHGTGTNLGDPIEIEALTQAFNTSKKGYCAVGSVKTNVGHLGSAAGIAGFIKTVLSLKHQLIPPSLHFKTPNPEIDFENTPFYVNTVLSEWKCHRHGHPLRAGVSSFGIGGTNAHIILEEAPIAQSAERKAHGEFGQGRGGVSPPSPSRQYQLILLSAKTETALEKMTKNLAEYFRNSLLNHGNPENPGLSLADAAYTLQVGRQPFNHRRMVVCSTTQEAVEILSTPASEKIRTAVTKEGKKPVIFMFPGQGAQYVNMGRELYETEPYFRQEMERCFEILEPLTEDNLKEILYPGEMGNRTNRFNRSNRSNRSYNTYKSYINQTEIAQPLLFAIEYSLARLLMKWGIEPHAMIGHSIGEYTAACLSGVFSLTDALELVTLRGSLMQQMPPGTMLSISISEKQLKPLLAANQELSLAAVNTPSGCVVSGSNEAAADFEIQLKEQNKQIQWRQIHTSHAFHSKMMEPMIEEFEENVRQIQFHEPQVGIPYISNLTGSWTTVEEAVDPGYWAKHLRQTVRFAQGVTELLTIDNAIFIEVGPGRSLSTFVNQHPDKKTEQKIIHFIRHPRENISDAYFLLSKIGEYWLYGKTINWAEYYNGNRRYRVPIPLYPFERKCYWIDIDPTAMDQQRLPVSQLSKKPDIADWFYVPQWRRSLLQLRDNEETPGSQHRLQWLVFIDESQMSSQLAAQLRKNKHQVTVVGEGPGFREVDTGEYSINPRQSGDYQNLFKELQAKNKIPDRIVHLWGLTGITATVKETSSTIDVERIQHHQDLGFYSLLYIAQAIGTQGITRDIPIAVITSNMQDVTGEEIICPEKSTVLGAVKVIPKEYANLTCQSIDIVLPKTGSPVDEKLVRQLLMELSGDSPDPVVAYRGYNHPHRWVQTFEPVRLQEIPEKPGEPRLREKGIYLVTGGLGGIGLELAQYLVKKVKARLILTARSLFPSRNQWKKWLETHAPEDSTSRKIRKIQELEKLGGEVLICKGDASNQKQMQEVIKLAEKRLGTINGVIHSAGVPDGGIIQLRTRETTESILAAKVTGTLILDEILNHNHETLDFMMFCSSISSILAPLGQVGYVAANAFLDTYAHYKTRENKTFTVSVNWDAWQEVGMAAAARNQDYDKEITSRNLRLNQNWVLEEHTIEGKGVLPGTAYLDMVVSAFETHASNRNRTIEINNVNFLNPLVIAKGEEREVRVVLGKQEQEDTFDFKIVSRLQAGYNSNEWQEHTRGKVLLQEPEPAKKYPLKEIREACNKKEIIITGSKSRNKNEPRGVVHYGPRWNNRKWMKFGENHGLALLQLPDEFSRDLQTYKLHPALLDRATSFPMSQFKQSVPYFPFSYKKIKIKGSLPGKVFSYFREEQGNRPGNETLKYNISIMDEQGVELVEIEEFTLIRISSDRQNRTFVVPGNDENRKSAPGSLSGLTQEGKESPPETPGLTFALLSKEGVEVFHRILASPMTVSMSVPQVVVCTRDLTGLLEHDKASRAPSYTNKPKETLPSLASTVMSPRPELSTSYAGPRNQIECTIVEIWQQFFGIEPVGIHDDFFELGGDSLKVNTVASYLHQAFNVEIPLAEFFNRSTIAKLAEYIRSAETSTFFSILPGEKKDYYPLMSPQKRLFIIQQLDLENIAYNQPWMVTLQGELNRQKLEKTFKILIQRHESLRTSFGIVKLPEEEPIQRVHDEVEFEIEYDQVEVKENEGTGGLAPMSGKTAAAFISSFVRPFDLSKAPLFRGGIIKISETEHILMQDMHHIIADYISIRLFIKEFIWIYHQEELQGLRIQYKDYSLWQQQNFEAGLMKKQESHWLKEFSTGIPVLNLPTDYARPPIQSFEGSAARFVIGQEKTGQLKRLAAEEEVTLYMVLLAVYDIFLAKITGQEDVVVGTGVAGRRHTEVQYIIGIFVNTLAIRNCPNPWKSFRQFLKEIKHTTLEAFENQEYPFEILVDKVKVKRDTSRNPIFDTMLLLQNVEGAEGMDIRVQGEVSLDVPSPDAPGLTIKSYDYQQVISKFDLTLFVKEENGELHCHFEYCTKLFNTVSINGFITYFEEIAASVLRDPGQNLKEMEKISAERKKTIIHQLNRELNRETTALTAEKVTLQMKLKESFIRFSHHTAVEYGNQTITYKELNQRCDDIVYGIVKKGIPGQSFIGILLEEQVDFIVVLLAILKAGCAFVPLDSSYPPDRLESMIGATGIHWIITGRTNFNHWSNPGITNELNQPMEFIPMDHLLSLSLADHRAETVPEVLYSPRDTMYIYFTSGTTGAPRAMAGKNTSLLHFIDWEINTFDVNEGFRFSQFTNPVFDAFLRDVFVPLCAGGVICIPETREILLHSPQMISWLQRCRIRLIHCVPGLFRLLISKEYPDENCFKSLKYILLSGEPIRPSDLDAWYNKVEDDIQLVNLWGTSETTLAKTCYFIQAEDIRRQRIPVGKPLPGARVVVLDENLELCDQLVTGQLYIKTHFRTQGYYNQPSLNNQRFIPDPFTHDSHILLHKTGDLGRILLDGSIDVIGRNDRQVKIRGIRVELEEIESVMMQHPEVKEAAAVNVEISQTNQLLCAYITAKPDSTLTADTLLKSVNRFLREKLPDYMVPAKLITLEKLPRTPGGKVNYKALPDPLPSEPPGVLLPRDEIEKKLQEFWAGILKLERENISVTQSFFELGGNSLNIMNLVSQIHREFDVRIPMREIFNNSDISSQASIIRTARVDHYSAVDAVEKREYYPQSSAQKRLFFLDKFDEIGTSYNMSGQSRIKGKINKKRYEHAFKAIITHHQSLRTSFDIIREQAVQRVHPLEDLSLAVEYYDLSKGRTEDRRRKTEESRQGTEGRWDTDPSSVIRPLLSEFIRPFDLSKAPLFRIGLVEVSPQEHLFMFDMHHIISDGTSMRILPGDFMRLVQGEELPSLRVQYKDFSLWQNRLFETGQIKIQEEYWLNLYKGEIPRLNLPVDYEAPEVFTFEGERYRFVFEGEEVSRLRQFCASCNVTLFMNLLAAFNVLLFKHAGQEDIIVGCDIAGRPHADLQEIIGMFVNMLAMRNHPRGSLTYLEFLQEVKKNSLYAFENQDVQFEVLVDRLDLERNPAKNPLFDVEFLFRDIDRTMSSAQGSQSPAVGHHQWESETSKFDMALEAYEMVDRILFRMEYYTPLFKRETIQLLMNHYITILRTVIRDPGVWLEQLDIMSEAERRQILFTFNNTRKDFPKSKCYHRLYCEQASRTPDHTAAVYGDESVSYAHLEEESNRVANYLHHGVNIAPGDRAAVLMDRSIFFLTALIGILKSGGIYVPIVATLPEARIKAILEDAGIRVVISREKYLRTLDRLQWESSCFAYYLCLDSWDIYSPMKEDRLTDEWLNQEKLWEYIAETAVDDITGGGWLTSYTGQPFTPQEMAEYGDNALKKLTPILNSRMRVLEIGCASGLTMYRLAPQVAFYYGTDFSRTIIQRNKERVDKEGHGNIILACLAAHEIDQIEEKNFDLIILNSVIQSFHGHNYLVRVLHKAINLLTEKGFIFAGDIMDLDLKENLIDEMKAFKEKNKEKQITTKTDFSEELFLSRAFFQDTAAEIPLIDHIEFSNKIYTIENELTKFRYDVLIHIDKTSLLSQPSNPTTARRAIKSFCGGVKGGQFFQKAPPLAAGGKKKHQHDCRMLFRFSDEVIDPGITPGDLAYIIYTSGTTGQPKGVMIHHQGMLNHMYAKINDLAITGDDIIAQTASAGFDISIWQFLAGLLTGARTHIIDKETLLDQSEFLKTIKKARVTILETVPSLMSAFLQMVESIPRCREDKKIKFLRWLIPTGEALAVGLVREWYKHYPGIKVINAYGPTEASDDVTHYVVDEIPPAEQKSIPIGKPLQNLHIYILDENLHLCPVRVRGEICVAGIGVGKGYWRNPRNTTAAFVPNPYIHETDGMKMDDDRLYRTGDIGYWQEDGNIQCLGRMDHQVKIRGNRIELGEIENRLINHEEIKEAVVIDREDEAGNKYLCAYVVLRFPRSSLLSSSEMAEYLSASLPDYMIPSNFMQLEKFPLTPNGKIDRKALPVPDAQEAADHPHEAPRTRVQEKMARIWAEVLNMGGEAINTSIGINDDFFQLGGHSLKATILVTKIHKEFNVKIPLAEIFKTPTIKNLSQFVTKVTEVEVKYTSIKPLEKKEYYPQSSAQKRLFLLDQFEDIGVSYNIPAVLKIFKQFDKVPYLNAIRALIKRHETLRTSFQFIEDVPVQVVHDAVDFEIQEVRMGKNSREKEIREKVSDFVQPFDLAKAPLIRVGFIKLPGEEYLLLYDIHHIVSDGTSANVMLRDFKRLYMEEELPGLQIQYKDFSHWQTHLSWTGKIKEQEDYWLNLFTGEIPRLNLPYDFPRPSTMNFDGDRYGFLFGHEELSGFKKLCSENSVTLYMNLLCVFNMLLYKYSGQEDIIVGSGIAGRRHADLQELIGMFVNTLAMRNYPNGEKTYLAFLKEVKENCVKAFENQDMQFEEMVYKLKIERDPSRNPLFDVELNVQNYEMLTNTGELDETDIVDRADEIDKHEFITHYNYENKTSKFDLILYATEVNSGIYLDMEYSTALFKRDTIKKMMKHYVDILKQVTADKNIKLKEIAVSHDLVSIKSEIVQTDFGF